MHTRLLVTNMRRYFKLWLTFVKNCWIAAMEFRANFFTWTIVNIGWAVLALVFVNLIFGQVTSIAGWNKNEVLLLAATQVVFISVLWFSVFPNATRFSQLVRNGDLDFALLKPISLRFLVSTRYIEFDNLSKIILAPIFFPILLRNLGISVQPLWVINFLIMFSLGIIIFYNFFFMIMTTNIWFQNIFNLENLLDSITETGKFPIDIFKGFFRTILIYLVPVAYIATFPVEALLGRVGWERIIPAIFLAVGTFALSHWFWNFSLRHYSSASS